MNNKYILIIFSLILFSNLVIASDDAYSQVKTLPPVAQYNCKDIIETCPNCTYVNISSIVYPNYVDLNPKIMTKIGTNFNYTFCNTSELGQYIINFDHDLDGIQDIARINFFVTKSGEVREINPFTPLISIIFFGLICLVLSFFLPGIIKYVLWALSSLSAYTSIQYSLIVLQGYALVNNLSTDSYLVTFYQVFTWIVSGIITLLIIFLFIKIKDWFQIRKGFKDKE